MAFVKQYHPLTWLVILCSPLLATAAEYTILANFKDSQRLDKGIGSAEFINTNGVPNHINSIGSAQQFSGSGSNSLQSTSGITTSYGIMPEERAVLDTFTMATVNHTYYDSMDELFRLMGENNAKFGEGKVFPVHGRLVHVTSAKDPSDHSACHPNIRDSAGHRLPAAGEPWIALVRRGVCKFEDKVRNVYNYNAVGVIVYNDRDSQNLDKMQILDKERNITSVFTYKGIGEQLAALLAKGYEVNTTITPGETITKQMQTMNRTSVLFVSISFIILMIISLVWLVFYYVQRFRYLQSKDKQSRRMCNVAKRIIAKIPTKTVRTEDKELQNECCPICIEQYRVGDLVRVLPCKHEFHRNCIDPWLLDHRLCPMCKMDILKYYGFVFTGSQESILQMDLDVGEDMDEENNHSRGISPMPQINERMLSRSSSLASDVDIQVVTEATPSLTEHWSERDPEADDTNPTSKLHPHSSAYGKDEVIATSTVNSPHEQPPTTDPGNKYSYQKNNSGRQQRSQVQIQVDDEELVPCSTSSNSSRSSVTRDSSDIRSGGSSQGFV